MPCQNGQGSKGSELVQYMSKYMCHNMDMSAECVSVRFTSRYFFFGSLQSGHDRTMNIDFQPDLTLCT